MKFEVIIEYDLFNNEKRCEIRPLKENIIDYVKRYFFGDFFKPSYHLSIARKKASYHFIFNIKDYNLLKTNYFVLALKSKLTLYFDKEILENCEREIKYFIYENMNKKEKAKYSELFI